VGVVTRPFSFEGRQRARNAEEGVRTLHEHVHTLITIPCDRLLETIERKTTLDQAFLEADDVLRQAIQGISDLLTQRGLLNLGLADIKAVLSQSGAAVMAIGRGTGETRVADAARRAISSPLLNNGLEGARRVLLNITGGSDLTLSEISEAADLVSQATAPEATISFGAVIDPRLAHEAGVTLFVTGGRPHSQLQGGSGPPPPESAPLGARLPRRPRAPSDHAAALPPPSLDSQDEPVWFRLIPRIDPRAPGPSDGDRDPAPTTATWITPELPERRELRPLGKRGACVQRRHAHSTTGSRRCSPGSDRACPSTQLA
jgi:cell division protein FtsZ